jgi:hypothetical protein
MANIPTGTKFLGLSSSFPTVEKKSALKNAVQEYYTAEELIGPYVNSIVTAETVTPNADIDDMINITAVAADFTLGNPTGTPTQGQSLFIGILDDGTGRAITFGDKYRAIGVTLPATTTASKQIYLGCIYNSTADKWDVVGVNIEA